MTNKFYFFRDGNQSSIAPDQSTRCHRLVSLSLVSRQSVLPILLLFSMLFLGIGQMWGEDATMTGGTNGSNSSVSVSGTTYTAVKVGTTSKGGTMTITIPQYATKLSLYAAAWNGVTGLSLNITPNAKVDPTSISLTANSGISGSTTPFSFSGSAGDDYFFDIDLSNINEQTTLTFTSSAAKRFVVWGAKVCYDPTSPSSGSMTTNSARVSWTDTKNVNNYEVYYSTSPTAPTASSSGTTTTNKYLNLTNLSPGTTYYWWVRAYDSYCKTDWVAGGNFTTTAAGYTITAQSNNTNYGTVSGTTTITASPKSGYRVSTSTPYSVSPANSATVNQSGNTFTVNPSANTTVTINFEEIPSHNINFHINGGSVESSSISVREGDTRGNFPSVTGLTTNCEYGTFVGWTQATSIASASTCPALVTSVTMSSSDVELYAVYSKTVDGTGASVGTPMLSEDFEDFDADDYPTAPGENATTYASGITYTCDPNSSSGTRVMNSGGPGEEANNIIVKQNGSFAITNIPTGGASTLTFSCAVGGSKTLTITSTSDDVSLGSNTGTTSARTYTLTVSNNATSFGLNFAASGGNMRLDDISIVVATTANSGSTDYSLDANCCEPLGAIKGSINLSQLAEGVNAGKLQATWDEQTSTDGWAANGIQINIYEEGNATPVVTSAALANTTTTFTATGFTPKTCTNYYATLTALHGDDASYCAGDLVSAPSANVTTAGYTYVNNSTNVNLVAALPASTCANGGADVDIQFTAATGYRLPTTDEEIEANVTVTNAGEKDEDWFCSVTNNVLTISLSPSKATGNIGIKVDGIETIVSEITVSTDEIDFNEVKKGTPTSTTFTVEGAHLSNNITLSSDEEAFTLSSYSLTQEDGSVALTTITLTANTSTAGEYMGTITISDGNEGATDKSIGVYLTVLETYTVNWYVNGTKVHEQTDVANTAYDAVPSDFSAFDDCKDGLTFIDWSETAFGSTTSAPSLANIGTKITANKDYYAVFAEGTPASTTKLLNEDFIACTGTGGNNTDGWNGNIASANIPEALTSTWAFENSKAANGCVKCGTSSLGTATTPELALTGAATLTFKAAAWNGNSESTNLKLSAEGATLKQNNATISSVTMVKGEWTSYTVDITGGNGEVTIKFEGNAASNARFFLDDVVVSQEVAANWTKWYTTCPHAYIVALSPATNGNGTISFAKNASAITEIETTGEDAVTVDVVASPVTGYELTGVALSGIVGASYNAGVITLPANTEGPLTATATFSKANYAVTYTAPSNGTYTIKVGDAAAVSENTTAQYGQTITLAGAPAEGYQFIGWTVTKTVGGEAIAVDGNGQFTMPAEAVTVAATFQEIPAVAYTVTFSQGDHGTCTESSLEEESAGAGVTLPSCTAATGYAFLGWTATENKTSVDEGLTTGALYRPEGNITLYAVYKQLKAVTLMKRDNSGTDVVLYEDVATGKVELPARTCKNNSYTFAGWSTTYYSTEQEDADAVILATGEYTPMGNITLYPVFSRSSESYVWTKITDLSTVTEGTYALVSTDNYAFNGTMSSGHGQKTATAFAFTEGVAEAAPEGTCILEFQAVSKEEVVVGYKMYNETNGYLYASAASSGKLAWHNEEESYWKEGNGDWLYNANSAHLRVYDNTFRTYSGSSNNALAMAKKTTVLHSLYLAAPANVVAAPTFDPVAGAYYGAQNVTISSETDDVTIYYTEDNSEPSDQSTAFTDAFSVSSSKTIKAIAIDEDGYSSAVTEAAYTIYPVYNSIAAYQAASAQEAATAKVVINKESANAIVIGVTGSYTYVQDGTAAMVIKRPNANDPWTVGSELDGYVQGTRSTYYGLPMITVADVENVATSTGTPVLAQTVSNLDFAGAWSSYAGNLIKVESVYFQAQATSERIVALADGAEHTGAIYDALFKIDGANLPLTATACDVTGILVARQENEVTTHYIAPTALTDISTKGAVAQLNVSPVGGADAEHAVGIAPGGQVTVTPVDGFATTLNDEAINAISTVDVTAPTSITVSASRQFYTDNNQLYYYEVDESYMPVTVTQPANAGGSTISADKTSAQENDVVTLSRNVAEHYHFNGWNVYKTGDAETTVTVTNNQFNMPAYAVTVEADIEEDAYATVVFDGGDATGTAPASEKKYVGQEVTMPNKGALVKADHILASWTYNKAEYAVGDTYEIQAGDAAIGGKNITFTANWTAYPWANGGDWMLVTDAAEVTAGSYVIIAASGSNVAMSNTQNNNNRAQQSISKNDNRLTYTTAPAIFEVRAGNIENTLAFYDVVNEGYIYAASSGSNYLRTEATLSNNSSWAVEITNTAVAEMQAQGTNTRDKLQYNSNDNLFSCYSDFNKASVSLYKYYAPVPKVTYDKNTEDEVTNMPNPSVQRAENNKATIAAGPSRTGYTFEGWKNGNTTYTVGEEYTFTEDITLYAQWEALPSFHVTYNTSGSQGTTPTDATNYYEGDEVTLAPASGLSNAGYFFDKWVATYVDGNSDTQTLEIEDGKFTMPAFNVTVTATWARKSSDKWIKVTEVSQLTTGKEYIIVNTDATYAVGAQNSNNRAAAAIEENNGILTISDAVAKFTLGIPEADRYTFYQNGTVDNVDKGYLYAASSSSNYMRTQTSNNANGIWTISIGEEGAATITATGTNTRNIMRYNSTSKIFSCYGSGQSPVVLYYKAPKIEINDSESVNVSDAAGSDIVIHDGGTLVVNEAATIGDLTVENGGKVTLNSNKLTVVGTFTIETTMASGESGQLNGATASNFEASEAYIDITLGAGGTNQQWHAFTVPFPVDVMNGIYDLDGNKLVNEVNYAIMEYLGDVRAQGKYGWKKIRTTLVPGTFYIMATDGYRTTYRFKKKAGEPLVAANSKQLYKFEESGNGVQGTDNGWNGVGNPNLFYGKVGLAVQVLDPESYTYVTKTANSTNFVVGTPFFYQAAAAGTMVMATADAGANYAPARVQANEIKDIPVSFGNEIFTDYLYVSANEDALNTYETGKDLVKMTMTNTPKVAQIYGKAYNSKLSMVYTPIVNNQAEVALELYAPANGQYTISAPSMENVDLYLTQNGSIIWNLSMSAYELELTKGTTEGYGLLLQAKAPGAATGVDNIDASEAAQKVIINDHVYILRNGQMYGVDGKAVK